MQLAIGYLSFFLDNFITHESGVFLKANFTISAYQKFKNATSNQRELEAVLNHLHILDLFGYPDNTQQITRNQILYFGSKLKEIWELKLKRDFPDRKFIVEFTPAEEPDELIDYQITFYQKEA